MSNYATMYIVLAHKYQIVLTHTVEYHKVGSHAYCCAVGCRDCGHCQSPLRAFQQVPVTDCIQSIYLLYN